MDEERTDTGESPPDEERSHTERPDGSGEGVPDRGDDTVETHSATLSVVDLLDQLDELEDTITTAEQHRELQETRQALLRLPASARFEHITKYTSRDVGEAFVGGLVFAVPMLVEDGVFVIAEHLLEYRVAGVPLFLTANVVFTIALTYGLIYGVDFREVQVSEPILGIVPRRLVGVLAVSFLSSFGLLVLWGRTQIGDPTPLETFARVSVVWTVAALGASLGDILPGESKGTDLVIRNLDDIIDFDDD